MLCTNVYSLRRYLFWFFICFFALTIYPLQNAPAQTIPAFEMVQIIGDSTGEGQLSNPLEVQVDQEGNIYVLDSSPPWVKIFDADGNFTGSFGMQGQAPEEIGVPRDLVMNANNEILILDNANIKINTYTTDGEYVRSYSFASQGFGSGTALALDSENNIYLYGLNQEKRIHKFSPDGEHLLSFLDAIPVETPRIRAHVNNIGAIAISGNDEIYVVQVFPYTLMVFNTEGELIREIEPETQYAKSPFVFGNNYVMTPFVIQDMAVMDNGAILVGNWDIPVDPDDITPQNAQQLMADIYAKYAYVDILSDDGDVHHKNMSGFSGFFGFTNESNHYYEINLVPYPRIVEYEMAYNE